MTRKQRKTLWRILIAAVLYIAALAAPLEGLPRLTAFLIVYASVGRFLTKTS